MVDECLVVDGGRGGRETKKELELDGRGWFDGVFKDLLMCKSCCSSCCFC